MVLCGLGARLAWVQVMGGPALAEAAVEQRALTVPLSPTRGRILDRHGAPLSDSRLSYRVAVYPAFLPAESAALDVLAQSLDSSPQRLLSCFGDGQLPVFVASGLGPERAAAVMGLGLTGVAVVADETRYGPGSLARHAVGYVGGAGPGAAGGGWGQDGLERAWDTVLRGMGPHLLALFVDGRGEVMPQLGWRKLFRGTGGSPWTSLPCDIVTTIDSRVQRVVEEVMDARVSRGAVVVMDPHSGDILAVASRPDYDQDGVAAHLDRADGSLLNRALAAYPPGSVFKPLVMAAALESGAVMPDETFTCRGKVAAAGRVLLCHSWAGGGHGEVSLTEAVRVSCNAVFVEIGQRLGQDELAEWAARFGLGRTTGTGLPGEAAGSLPGPEENGPEPEAAFGQGSVLTTPIQIARAYSVIANGGRLVQPRLAREIRSPAGVRAGVGGRTSGGGEAEEGRVISRFTAAEVTAALTAAVADGTGRAAGTVPGVAGKTGTVETGRLSPGGAKLYAGWFAGFWPAGRANSAQMVIVVLVEDSTVGGREAADVFGEIVRRVAEGR
jgi:cell division protein FtsI/penicillin-binding protein 2